MAYDTREAMQKDLPEFLCGVCLQYFYRNGVNEIEKIRNWTEQAEDIKAQLHDGNFTDLNWLCIKCHKQINAGKIPDFSELNGMHFPEAPAHLGRLSVLERILISPVIPFSRFKELYGSYMQSMKGVTVCIPAKTAEITKMLPRRMDELGFIWVSLKRRLSQKHAYLSESIDVPKLYRWLHWLLVEEQENLLYEKYDQQDQALWKEANFDFLKEDDSTKLTNQPQQSSTVKGGNTKSPESVAETENEKLPTLLVEDELCKSSVKMKHVTVAPGEGGKPIITQDYPNLRELAFLNISLGKPLVQLLKPEDENEQEGNKQKQLPWSQQLKWRLRHKNREAARTWDFIFWEYSQKIWHQLHSCASSPEPEFESSTREVTRKP